MQKYSTQRNVGALLPFSLVFLFLICIMLVVISISSFRPDSTIPSILVLFLCIVFCAFWVYLFLKSYAWYTYYGLDAKHLVLQGSFSKKKIILDSIVQIKLIDYEQAHEIIKAHYEKIASENAFLGLKASIESANLSHEIIKFSSFHFSQMTSEINKYIDKEKSHPSYALKFVYVTTDKNCSYILSPVNAERFYDELRIRFAT